MPRRPWRRWRCSARRTEGLSDEGEVPFIEVGGPRTEVAGSPAVFAAPAPNGVAPPATTAAGPGGPVQVSFRPLPAAPPLPKPACERFAPELVAFHEPE